MKKLYKSNNNKVFFGVIGGIGEHFDIDPVILRIIWIVVMVFTALFPGIIVYIIAALIIPNKPKDIE